MKTLIKCVVTLPFFLTLLLVHILPIHFQEMLDNIQKQISLFYVTVEKHTFVIFQIHIFLSGSPVYVQILNFSYLYKKLQYHKNFHLLRMHLQLSLFWKPDGIYFKNVIKNTQITFLPLPKGPL